MAYSIPMSNYDWIRYRVQSAINLAESVPLDELNKDFNIETDLQLDPLSYIELLMYIEDELSVSLDQDIDERILKLKTVHDFVEYIVDYFNCVAENKSHPILDAHPNLRLVPHPRG
ncbi:hypothetical protein LMH73_009335 [Vibrio splendidus]|nr:hypothetical protein [Vibrio splendidus]MCC4881860.1 hypothetical protein [Vibrio splendidus]